jgi:hypothetical protein
MHFKLKNLSKPIRIDNLNADFEICSTNRYKMFLKTRSIIMIFTAGDLRYTSRALLIVFILESQIIINLKGIPNSKLVYRSTLITNWTFLYRVIL